MVIAGQEYNGNSVHIPSMLHGALGSPWILESSVQALGQGNRFHVGRGKGSVEEGKSKAALHITIQQIML